MSEVVLDYVALFWRTFTNTTAISNEVVFFESGFNASRYLCVELIPATVEKTDNEASFERAQPFDVCLKTESMHVLLV